MNDKVKCFPIVSWTVSSLNRPLFWRGRGEGGGRGDPEAILLSYKLRLFEKFQCLVFSKCTFLNAGSRCINRLLMSFIGTGNCLTYNGTTLAGSISRFSMEFGIEGSILTTDWFDWMCKVEKLWTSYTCICDICIRTANTTIFGDCNDRSHPFTLRTEVHIYTCL